MNTKPRTSNLVIEDYFDIWRGAFYSVILGLIYTKTILVKEDWPKGALIVFSVLATIYLVLDGITRYNSRRIAQIDNEENKGHKWTLWLLIIEMAGMLFFAVGATKMDSYLTDPNKHLKDMLIMMGWFGVFNFVHNSILFRIDPKWDVRDYVSSFFSGFNETVKSTWLFDMDDRIKTHIAERKKEISRARKLHNKDEEEAIRLSGWILIKDYYVGFKSSWFLLIMYYLSAHFIVFNCVLTIWIFLLLYGGCSPLNPNIYVVLALTAASLLFYTLHLVKLIKNSNSSGFSWSLTIANICLYFTLFSAVFMMDVNNLLYLFFGEGALFSVTLLIVTKPSDKSIEDEAG